MKRKDRQKQPPEPNGGQPIEQMEENIRQTTSAAAETAEAIEAANGTDEAATKPAVEQDDTVQALQTAVAAKEKEIAALSDKYLRLMAEYDNYRKRSQKEKDAIYADSVVQVIREWLPVIDNLDRAELAADQYKSEEASKIADGIVMISKQVEEILAKLGVEAITCCGQSFDPNMHDAVMHVEDETVGASTVVEELRKGYRLDDRVIRHSVVKVAN